MRSHLLLMGALLASLPPRSAGQARAFDPAQPHINELGMRFVPVAGTKVQFSIYETRVKDFRVFIRESGYVHMRETADSESRMWSLDQDGNKQRGHSWEKPGFPQTEEHPVAGVSWHDAKAFCEWLTVRERAASRLPAGWEYRLPTDHEWSVAVGLAEDEKLAPEAKDGGVKDRYPWGTGWPPTPGCGNYAGEEADDGRWPKNFRTIESYRDGHARTAPVGSFKPNELGIYDLGGNVWEWCEDAYRPDAGTRVLRGASWSNVVRDGLLSSFRYYDHPAIRFVYFGFRCVVGSSSP